MASGPADGAIGPSEVKVGWEAGEGEGHMSVSVPSILHCLDGCGDFHAEELGPGAPVFPQLRCRLTPALCPCVWQTGALKSFQDTSSILPGFWQIFGFGSCFSSFCGYVWVKSKQPGSVWVELVDSRQEGQLNFRVEDLAAIFNSFRHSIVTTLISILFHSETKVSFKPHKITDIHPWDISWGLKKPPFTDPVGAHILNLNHHCLFWRMLSCWRQEDHHPVRKMEMFWAWQMPLYGSQIYLPRNIPRMVPFMNLPQMYYLVYK